MWSGGEWPKLFGHGGVAAGYRSVHSFGNVWRSERPSKKSAPENRRSSGAVKCIESISVQGLRLAIKWEDVGTYGQ